MMGKTAHNRRRRQQNRIRHATQKSEETKADRHASVKKTIAGPSPYSPQYFELQKDGYCQIHALNNAVQEKLLTPSMITTKTIARRRRLITLVVEVAFGNSRYFS